MLLSTDIHVQQHRKILLNSSDILFLSQSHTSIAIYIVKSRDILCELESSQKRHVESFPTITELPPRKRGGPLLLGNSDRPVQDYVCMLHISWGVVYARLVLAAARGLIIARNRTLLIDYRGSLNPDKPWAKLLLWHMGFVKRKASTFARVPVQDFSTI